MDQGERLLDYAHKLRLRIMAEIPTEHRAVVVAWLHSSFSEHTGELKEVEPMIDVKIRCDDCPDLATKACEDCEVVRGFEDTVTE